MTEKHPLLQEYEKKHDDMMDAERGRLGAPIWPLTYGLYVVARYNAVRAGLIPEQPQFDEVES